MLVPRPLGTLIINGHHDRSCTMWKRIPKISSSCLVRKKNQRCPQNSRPVCHFVCYDAVTKYRVDPGSRETQTVCLSPCKQGLIVDILPISKLFAPFVPIYSQFRRYICYLGEFVNNKTHRFQCFSTNDIIIKNGLN